MTLWLSPVTGGNIALKLIFINNFAESKFQFRNMYFENSFYLNHLWSILTCNKIGVVFSNLHTSTFHILLQYTFQTDQKRNLPIYESYLCLYLSVCCMQRTFKIHIEISYLTACIFYIISINGITFIFRTGKCIS